MRLVSQGISRLPTTVWMASETPPTSSAISMLLNCRKAMSPAATSTITEPMYGMRLVTAAMIPHTAAFSTPSSQNARPVVSPTSPLTKICTSR
ncbi:hypothetical protein D9M69_677930 [compost metagenome]